MNLTPFINIGKPLDTVKDAAVLNTNPDLEMSASTFESARLTNAVAIALRLWAGERVRGYCQSSSY
tara:strand:+ start:115 stop:312 length:198 start_codon:yes stop_codon:yes gene_type:complete